MRMGEMHIYCNGYIGINIICIIVHNLTDESVEKSASSSGII
jgi:hypothetical protein